MDCDFLIVYLDADGVHNVYVDGPVDKAAKQMEYRCKNPAPIWANLIDVKTGYVVYQYHNDVHGTRFIKVQPVLE